MPVERRETRVAEPRNVPTRDLSLYHGLELTVAQQDREIEQLRAANLALLRMLLICSSRTP